MALNKKDKWFIFGGMALGLAAIFYYFKINIKKLYDYKWEFSGIKNLLIRENEISFTIFFKIKNDSDLSFIISEQNYDVYINNIYVSKIKNPNRIMIASNGTTQIPFDIEISNKLLDFVSNNIFELINKKENVFIKIKGYLSIKAGIFKLKKYYFEETLTLKEILSYKKTQDIG
jgi:LEA14-like dessication related protein